jgi:Spy/CpxP family protein refolding chaperone
MKRIFGMAVLAAIAVAPMALEAQTPRTGQERATRTPGQAPLARVLQHRAELGLTADQVNRLESIQQRLQAQNAPLLEQLRASGAWPRSGTEARERRQLTPEQREQMRQRSQNLTEEEREALREQLRERRQQREPGRVAPGARGQRQIPEELRPVVQQLRANTRAAIEEARAVLTTEQQAQLRELMQQRRGERPGGVRESRRTR